VEKLASILRDNPKGAMLNRDELAGWLESFGRYSGAGGAERAFWLEAFGGRQFRVDRQSKAEPLLIERLSVSILGGLQPDRLSAISGGADDGLSARFLFAWPDPLPEFSLHTKPIDGTKQQAALQRLYDLDLVQDEFAQFLPALIRLSPEAETLIEAFGRATKAEALASSGIMAGSIGKAPGHAIRIALVLEYLRWSEDGGREPREISREAMLRAIALVNDYFIPQAKRTFHEASIPADEYAAMFLAKWIKQCRVSEFNATETRRKLSGAVRDAKAMDAACDVLEGYGIVHGDFSRAGSNPGRKAKNFIVNPMFHDGAL
jgi:hypothetical protein